MKLYKYNRSIISLFLGLLIISSVLYADDILDFYVERAESIFKSHNPIERGLNYSFKIKTLYKQINKGGIPVTRDSSCFEYFYSFGELDSVNTIIKPTDFDDEANIFIPDIFNENYTFNFFPNDTGGEDLPIGFDTYLKDYTRPTGFIVIDRNRYVLRSIYMHYSHDRSDKRKSWWIKYQEFDNFVFPDSIYEQKAIRGIFTTDYYRLESNLYDINIYR